MFIFASNFTISQFFPIYLHYLILMQISKMAENLTASEIIQLAATIRQKIAAGAQIYNFTIGDFDSAVFPIPAELEAEIIRAYQEKETTYPPADGVLPLRKAIQNTLKKQQELEYGLNEILISGGARPIIYTIYETIIDPGETVVFAAPSWNNLHYSHLMRAKSIYVDTLAEDDFMPTAANLAPHLAEANLLALCSPLNPTGTVFSKQALSDICDLVLAENNRRKETGAKPLYILYDQIYCVLTFGDTQHYNPVSLCPALRDYTIFVDGASKCFAATGIRVGWAFGPAEIIDRMKAILSHIGAWAPKAEQMAVARFMDNEKACNQFISDFKAELLFRLEGLHNGLQTLKSAGFAVDSIAPQAAIYLSVMFDLKGKKTANGNVLETQNDVTNYLIDEAGMALVPFPIFGTGDSAWYRLSVGTCKREEVQLALDKLKGALERLS